MNYILNNKIKFEKNRYNKPISPRTPILLKNTPFINKVPLKLDSRIDTYPNINISNNAYISNSNIIDFKLKNYQMKTLISNDKLIQIPISKPIINPITKPIIKPLSIQYFYNDELIINIYGYANITDTTLYNFLLELSSRFKIRIYIYTYNCTTSAIEYYFQGLNVVSIIIDENINTIDSSDLIDSSKNIFSSNTPLSTWNKMLTAMFYSINEIYKREDDRTIILNTQFNINYTLNIDLNELRQTQFTKNIFLKDSTDLSGVDNPIIGDKNTLYKLIYTFYNNLDNVSMFYSSFKVPEASIFYENNRIFGVNIKNMFENIKKYNI
jgi:hypothetical protein